MKGFLNRVSGGGKTETKPSAGTKEDIKTAAASGKRVDGAVRADITALPKVKERRYLEAKD